MVLLITAICIIVGALISTAGGTWFYACTNGKLGVEQTSYESKEAKMGLKAVAIGCTLSIAATAILTVGTITQYIGI